MKILFYIIYYVIQFTWGLLQNIAGLIYYLKTKKTRKVFFNGATIGFHDQNWGGISLGIFILINSKKDETWIRDTMIHEYGHSIQSLILGPLYFLVIGIPSFIWCNSKRLIEKRKRLGLSYFSFYPERWANFLGEKFTNQKILNKPS